jgi:branched-chain amino acid transport system ATP-binding protein
MLSIAGLSVSYGAIEAVRDISINVASGEVVALLGSNGAGKTTTLAAISGLVRPTRGSIEIDGRSLVGVPAHVVVQFGVCQVPEGRRIFGALTVEENLNLGGYTLSGGSVQMYERRQMIYARFPILAQRRRQLAGNLSGGEQQMLAIGRALMRQPKVLALDEPSLGLSPMLTKVILRTVQEVAHEGAAVLLVEQNMRQALRIADRAYVLESGRIVLQGSAHDMLGDPRVQRAYLGAQPNNANKALS